MSRHVSRRVTCPRGSVLAGHARQCVTCHALSRESGSRVAVTCHARLAARHKAASGPWVPSPGLVPVFFVAICVPCSMSISHIRSVCCQVLKNSAAAEKDEDGEALAPTGGNVESEHQEDEKMELVLQAVRNALPDMLCQCALFAVPYQFLVPTSARMHGSGVYPDNRGLPGADAIARSASAVTTSEDAQ